MPYLLQNGASIGAMLGCRATPSASCCARRAMPPWPGRRTAGPPGTRRIVLCRHWPASPSGAGSRPGRQGVGVVDRDVDRGAPAFARVGAAVAGQAGGQRLDRQAQAIALVAIAEAADRQDGAGWVLRQHGRIIGRVALGVHQPGFGECLAGGDLAVAHAVGRDRRRDVDQHRTAGGGKPDRDRVGRHDGPGAAKRRHAGGIRVGAGDDAQHAFFGHAHQVDRQTGDMVAAPDHHRRQAELARGRESCGRAPVPSARGRAGAGRPTTSPPAWR